jgi:hypothetical protein
MAWDASALLQGDPDQPGELIVRLIVSPGTPLPLAIVECAANLDVAVRVKKPNSIFHNLDTFELEFTGKCIDLSELDMRMSEWQIRHKIPSKSEQDLYSERAAIRSKR